MDRQSNTLEDKESLPQFYNDDLDKRLKKNIFSTLRLLDKYTEDLKNAPDDMKEFYQNKIDNLLEKEGGDRELDTRSVTPGFTKQKEIYAEREGEEAAEKRFPKPAKLVLNEGIAKKYAEEETKRLMPDGELPRTASAFEHALHALGGGLTVPAGIAYNKILENKLENNFYNEEMKKFADPQKAREAARSRIAALSPELKSKYVSDIMKSENEKRAAINEKNEQFRQKHIDKTIEDIFETAEMIATNNPAAAKIGRPIADAKIEEIANIIRENKGTYKKTFGLGGAFGIGGKSAEEKRKIFKDMFGETALLALDDESTKDFKASGGGLSRLPERQVNPLRSAIYSKELAGALGIDTALAERAPGVLSAIKTPVTVVADVLLDVTNLLSFGAGGARKAIRPILSAAIKKEAPAFIVDSLGAVAKNSQEVKTIAESARVSHRPVEEVVDNIDLDGKLFKQYKTSQVDSLNKMANSLGKKLNELTDEEIKQSMIISSKMYLEPTAFKQIPEQILEHGFGKVYGDYLRKGTGKLSQLTKEMPIVQELSPKKGLPAETFIERKIPGKSENLLRDLDKLDEDRVAIRIKSDDEIRNEMQSSKYIRNSDYLNEKEQTWLVNGMQGLHPAADTSGRLRDTTRLTAKGQSFLDELKTKADAKYGKGEGQKAVDAVLNLTKRTSDITAETVNMGARPITKLKTGQDYVATAPKDTIDSFLSGSLFKGGKDYGEKNAAMRASQRKSKYHGDNLDDINYLMSQHDALVRGDSIVKENIAKNAGDYADIRNSYLAIKDFKTVQDENMPTVSSIIKAIDKKAKTKIVDGVVIAPGEDKVYAAIREALPNNASEAFKEDLVELYMAQFGANTTAKQQAARNMAIDIVRSMKNTDLTPKQLNEIIGAPSKTKNYHQVHTGISQFADVARDNRTLQMMNKTFTKFAEQYPEIFIKIPKDHSRMKAVDRARLELAKKNGYYNMAEGVYSKPSKQGIPPGNIKASTRGFDVDTKYDYYTDYRIIDRMNNYLRDNKNRFRKFMESYNRLWKGGVTSAKPEGLAFALFNSVSAAIQSGIDTNPANVIKNYIKATGVLAAKNKKGAAATIKAGKQTFTPEQLIKEIEIRNGMGGLAASTESPSSTYERIFKDKGLRSVRAARGDEPLPIQVGKEIGATAAMPLAPSKSLPGKLMGKVTGASEDIGRVASVLMYLDKGYDMDSAVKMMLKRQIDYSALSPSWKLASDVGAFPFLAFFKGMMGNLITEPKAVKQLGTAYNVLKGQESIEPDYTRQGYAGRSPFTFTYKGKDGKEKSINFGRALMGAGSFAVERLVGESSLPNELKNSIFQLVGNIPTAAKELATGRDRKGMLIPELGSDIDKRFSYENAGNIAKYLQKRMLPGGNILDVWNKYVAPSTEERQRRSPLQLIAGSVYERNPYSEASGTHKQYTAKITKELDQIDLAKDKTFVVDSEGDYRYKKGVTPEQAQDAHKRIKKYADAAFDSVLKDSVYLVLSKEKLNKELKNTNSAEERKLKKNRIKILENHIEMTEKWVNELDDRVKKSKVAKP